MLKIKKILGILLALCFLVSVTAATAAADDSQVVISKEKYNKEVIKTSESYEKEVTIKDKNQEERKHGEEKRFGDRHEKKQGWGEREHGWGERENHRFNDHHKKRHHHPAHWEKKRFGHRVWEHNHGHWQTVYVYKMVYIAESYDYHS
ncbi:MAG: hypothetical protein ACM3O3_04745 [Syntrophothermus sp.]